MADMDALNDRFAVDQALRFERGPGGLIVARIDNGHARAALTLHGAHVMEYQPHGQEPVLWMSRQSWFEPGRPIRGGIPICWPWFGPHPSDPQRPAHGLARTEQWSVVNTGAGEDGATEMTLMLADRPASLALWPHPFELRLRVRVGRRLEVDLHVRNSGQEAFTCTGALHTYLSVGDVEAVTIEGLEDCPYLDKVRQGERSVQEGPISIAAETDRVYLDTPCEHLLRDGRLGRRIRVRKRGSRSTVVWNPWAAKAARLPDFGDMEYRGMVCIETANAADDAVHLPVGGEHTLGTTIELET